MNSVHGYFPEYEDSDGVIVSTIPMKNEYIELVDIMPSHLNTLKVSIPTNLDGRIIWKDT
jgi:hypothetical protein